jgi:hypothetical protein
VLLGKFLLGKFESIDFNEVVLKMVIIDSWDIRNILELTKKLAKLIPYHEGDF